MIDVCTHSSSATSNTISWCTPGGYDFTIVPKKSARECSMCVQICVVNSKEPWSNDVRTLYHAPTYWMTRRSNAPAAAAARQAARLAARPWLNAVRREALGWGGLPMREPIGDLDRSRQLALYPFSLAVFPKPPGWGDWAD